MIARPAPMPVHAWPRCDLVDLPARLAEGGWTLIEFWAPDVLYCRLLEPVRRRLQHSHCGRLRLLFCPLQGWAGCEAFGVIALPALVLFQGARRVRRWLGAVDVSLLAHDLDVAFADAAS